MSEHLSDVGRTGVTDRFEATGVHVSFGGVAALSDVAIRVPAGDVVGLIGSNGAGKSTLFDVLTGFLRPSAGKVRLEGEDITVRSPAWRARHGIRRTFQQQQVFGNLTVAENVLTALDFAEPRLRRAAALATGRLLPAAGAQERERTEKALETCGLAEVSNRSAAELSVGEARMLELARAIVADPIMLLLDEPTSGLGEAERDRFAEVVHGLRDRTGCGVLLVEHDVPFVMEHCSHITVLHLGRVIADGPPAVIADDPVVREAYLG